MTLYIIFSALAIVFFAVLAHLRKRYPDKAKLLCIIDSSTAVFGVILSVIAYILMYSTLSSSDEEFAEWMRDMLDMFFSIDIPLIIVLAFAVFVPAFVAWWDKKLRNGLNSTLRKATSVFAPAFILLVGGFYSAFVKNSTVSTDAYLRLFTFGEAMIFRAVYAVEYRSYLINRSNVKKK